MAVERAFTFECRGQPLVGICTDPGGDSPLGVLVVVGGPQYRVGCHRQFVLLARSIARRSVPAMRFDYRGMGDSGGEVQTFLDAGPDIPAAIDTFRAACPSVERVVLWGLCDAASASLLYWHATRDARVAGMMLLNPWISSDGKFAQAQIRQSMQRIMERDFWLKVFRGGIDIAGAVRKLASAAVSAAGRQPESATTEASFQARMAAGLATFDSPVLIVLSGQDLVAVEFAEQTRADSQWNALVARANVEQKEIPEADHTFSESACREHVETLMGEWLERSFALQTESS